MLFPVFDGTLQNELDLAVYAPELQVCPSIQLIIGDFATSRYYFGRDADPDAITLKKVQ